MFENIFLYTYQLLHFEILSFILWNFLPFDFCFVESISHTRFRDGPPVFEELVRRRPCSPLYLLPLDGGLVVVSLLVVVSPTQSQR